MSLERIHFTRYSSSALHNLKFEKLLQACCQVSLKYTAKLVSQALDKLDDVLFSLSEKAASNNKQTLYFEAMRTLRVERKAIERQFYQDIFKGFEHLFNGVDPNVKMVHQPRSQSLSLVDETDFEEALAVENIEHRVNNLYAEDIYLLNLRLSVLNSGVKIGERNPALPMSPAHLCYVLKKGLTELPINIEVKIVFCKVFDQHVMGRMKPLYDGLNKNLEKAGILPNLHIGQTTTQSISQPPIAAGQSKSNQVNHVELFKSVLTLLAARQKGRPLFVPEATNISQPLLLDALNNIQMSIASQAQSVQLALRQTKELTLKLDQEMNLLQTKTGHTNQVGPESADLIDLVGMLFTAILEDDDIPDAVKALLSYLQTPYLKVAIKDKGLFTFDYHPARRLLDKLVEAGKKYVGEDIQKSSIIEQIRLIVDTVLKKYANNIALFDALLADFEKFLRHHQQRVRHMEKRALETAKGKERMSDAKENAAIAIQEKTQGCFLPEPVENMIRGPWLQLLVLIGLSGDKKEITWQSAVQTIDDLTWSVIPKVTDEERDQHKKLIPALTEILHQGLSFIGATENEIEKRISAIAEYQSKAYSADLDHALVAKFTQKPITKTVVPVKSELSAALKAKMAELETLKNDQLFEFSDADHRERFKLIWFSPTSKKYLFIDRNNIKVKMIRQSVLAQDMLDQKARMVSLNEAPFVDRTLENIQKTLAASP